MAEMTEGTSMADAGLSIFSAIWKWTESSDTWRVVLVTVIFVVVLLVVLTACLSAIGKVLETLLKLVEAVKTSSLPRFMKREDRLKIRRREQFCSVLTADLTNITKAESWNDQWFTDLEAEVETEGGYYITPLHRFFGKVSTGLRKEKSLIKAISSSSERAIQLTGEPGSGKSVALRHLASQLAARARTSKAKDALVPLYINLREITVPPGSPVTTDTIRDFILDNIRRGDSDTTDYVRENWADYRERGIWFFLFDSFDEIPAVLHAEKGNPATKEYAEAIRMFLEGMGTCRGILASREFKGPESLPWMKFRILRLTSKKQQELVKNAFLTPAQERAVLHHLASNKSTLANTPLFLTLLCRYVKKSAAAPTNDYELLALQIDELAKRDPTYLKRTYNLTPAELLSGAQRIARLFAEESTLGLAPTIDQVEAVLNKSEIPGGDIQRFVAALVDTKIARADVAHAAPGDRRFAFAHRRYQEALFVRHLVAYPDYISGYDLLTDPRWREYAVTLLETQPVDALNGMFKASAELLAEAAASQQRQQALEPLKGYCGYFDWSGEAAQMLSLLQEGLARRVSAIPEVLSVHVEQFLKVRWETGDSFDRTKVIQVSALLPQATLGKYLEETFTSGSESAQNEAFNNIAALIGQIPVAVQRAVLNRLADEILNAYDTSAVLRVEALIARLPREFGAQYVQRRCIMLRRLTKIVSAPAEVVWPSALVSVLRSLFFAKKIFSNAENRRTTSAMFFCLTVVLYTPVLLHVSMSNRRMSDEPGRNLYWLFVENPAWLASGAWVEKIVTIGALFVMIIFTMFPIIFSYRAEGEALTIRFFARRIGRLNLFTEFLRKCFYGALGTALGWGLMYVFGAFVAFTAHHVLGVKFSAPDWLLGFVTVMVLLVCSAVIVGVMVSRRERESVAFFKAQLAQTPGFSLRALLSARNWPQFKSWLAVWGCSEEAEIHTGGSDKQLRSISAVLQHVQRGERLPMSVSAFLNNEPNVASLAQCINEIEKIRFANTTKLKLEAGADQ